MYTITVEIKDSNAIETLQDLEQKHFIKIVGGHLNSRSLPGNELSLKEFEDWIKKSGNSEFMELNKARKNGGIGKEAFQINKN
jgi:hypothetical protein